jgi:hypothetical protein
LAAKTHSPPKKTENLAKITENVTFSNFGSRENAENSQMPSSGSLEVV